MTTNRRGSNPFYVLLVLAGVAFTITACAYGVMTVRGLRPASRTAVDAEVSLLEFLDRYGVWLLLAELGILGGATVLAIGSDNYWTRRTLAAKSSQSSADPGEPHE